MSKRSILVTNVEVNHLGQGDGQELTIKFRSWDPHINPRALFNAHSLVVEPDRALKPCKHCKHCGQWGATMYPCTHCGAPIGD